jgi:5-methylcytosine-specific restriction protein A
MAQVKRYICASSGCFLIVDKPGTFCANHQAEQRARDARKAANNAGRWERGEGAAWRWVYRDPRWRKARAAQLKREMACRLCGQPALEVDHIIPHRGREEFAFNPDNLQSLCHGCHEAKTKAQRGQR